MAPDMQQLINDAKARGLTVYGPRDMGTYFYFTDGEKIGYCQLDRMRGPSWATVHKPNRTTGTGFKAESLDQALQFVPPWASGGDCSTVQKYTNWAEFAKKNWQPLIQQ